MKERPLRFVFQLTILLKDCVSKGSMVEERKRKRMRGLSHAIKENRLRLASAAIILSLISLFSSCDVQDKAGENPEEKLPQVYYINIEETKIVEKDYKQEGTTPEELIKEYLDALATVPEDISIKKVIPDDVMIESKLNKEGRLSLYFNSNYNNLTGITEVLCRAAIVKTLCQIEEVDSVEFYVNNDLLKGYNGQTIKSMGAEDFITNTMEAVRVKMYFSNKKGNALIPVEKTIANDGNVSIEQLIIQQLIAGPSESDKGMIKTLPEGTELIKVTTNDGICYVNFNEKFLNNLPPIKDEVVIYSVVNSLDELSTIKKVQFTINGEVKKFYKENITLDEFFSMKLDLIKGSK